MGATLFTTGRRWTAVCLLGLALAAAGPGDARALEPEQILVVANRDAAGSVRLARHYMERRGIPRRNLVKVGVTDAETCSRKDYEQRIAGPVKAVLDDPGGPPRIRCVVLMYGLPLRVAPPEQSRTEQNAVEDLKRRQADLEGRAGGKGAGDARADGTVEKELEAVKHRIASMSKAHRESGAAVDSEIALVRLGDYPLTGWVPNPYYLGHRGKTPEVDPDAVLMVSRLDGPSEAVVRRIIHDSILAEERGLDGTAYFDARWEASNQPDTSGYGFYDQSIHKAADRVTRSGLMPVVLDRGPELFQPGTCPDAALYCGWYSLAKYVDAFDWVPGAVGFHIASSECATLRKKESQVWCKALLEDGVAATIGPVSEPYINAFAVPEIFFGFLVDGYLTLAECYLISAPVFSWQMILVGDPLYRPFKNRKPPGDPLGAGDRRLSGQEPFRSPGTEETDDR